jgi:hypothetical protein
MDMDFIPPVSTVALTLTGIGARAQALEPAWQAAFKAQERAQEEPFRSGRMVASGDLRDSLTQPNATGAIREAHGSEALFGTDIRYARPAAARSGTHVLVPPVDEIAALTMTYVIGDGAL